MFAGSGFQTDPNGSGPKIEWDRSLACLHGNALEPVGTEPKGMNTGLAVLQVKFWILTGPVPNASRT